MKIGDTFLQTILTALVQNEIRPVLVGGCVRDFFLGIEVKDYDIEVYGLDTIETLENILSTFGRVNLVGKSFGIVKLSTDKMEYDFSFPRLENKIGDGHRGFEVSLDGTLSFEKAAKRRDFTINAIGYDYMSNTFLDPFDGKKDIDTKILRLINKDTFLEDPLRVYRAVQFYARFAFEIDPVTYSVCQDIVLFKEFRLLSKERIFEEYKKLFLKAKSPSRGLSLITHLHIEKIPEQTQIFIDQIAAEVCDEDQKLFLIFFLLEEVASKIICNQKLLKKLAKFRKFISDPDIPKKVDQQASYTQQLYQSYIFYITLPKPKYTGKDLIKMGYEPSEKFKSILDTLYKMQLSGKI